MLSIFHVIFTYWKQYICWHSFTGVIEPAYWRHSSVYILEDNRTMGLLTKLFDVTPLCVENNTIFPQMLENKRAFVRGQKPSSYRRFPSTQTQGEIFLGVPQAWTKHGFHTAFYWLSSSTCGARLLILKVPNNFLPPAFS